MLDELDEISAAPTEAEKILNWRLAVLLHAGYEVADAERLAGDTHVDLHQAVELVKNGCASETAVRILT